MTNASKVARLRESPGRIEADCVPATFTPILEVAEGLVKLNGLFSMYESVDSRKSCGNLRKMVPLKRALASKKSWLAGLRREQAPCRQALGESEFDAAHGMTKFNPLIDRTADDVGSASAPMM